jgi:hypothetical protein
MAYAVYPSPAVRQFCRPDTMTRLGYAHQMLPAQHVPALQQMQLPHDPASILHGHHPPFRPGCSRTDCPISMAGQLGAHSPTFGVIIVSESDAGPSEHPTKPTSPDPPMPPAPDAHAWQHRQPGRELPPRPTRTALAAHYRPHRERPSRETTTQTTQPTPPNPETWPTHPHQRTAGLAREPQGRDSEPRTRSPASTGKAH